MGHTADVRWQPIATGLALVVASIGCAPDTPDIGSTTVPSDTGTSVGGELVVRTLVSGLGGPTQIAHDGHGGFVVAELNGGERDGTGRVVRFESLPGEPAVLVDGLLTPTGVVVDADDRLWIMEQRRLTAGPLDDSAERRIVLDELPFNGRSEGTLSAVPDGGVLFDTSGSRRGDRLVPGSGSLWFLASPDDEPEVFASGFKHAYGHAPADELEAAWFVTEMSDGRLDGAVPPDELVVARRGDDFGYPRCIGDGVPVAELGATAEDCADTPPSLALFPPGATPTSVVRAPWDPDLLLVTLWNRGQVVALPAAAGPRPHEPVVIVDTLERPQHLLVDGDRVLATDFAAGTIVEIRPSRS